MSWGALWPIFEKHGLWWEAIVAGKAKSAMVRFIFSKVALWGIILKLAKLKTGGLFRKPYFIWHDGEIDYGSGGIDGKSGLIGGNIEKLNLTVIRKWLERERCHVWLIFLIWVIEWVVMQANEIENARVRASLGEKKDVCTRDLLLCIWILISVLLKLVLYYDTHRE